jgi:hypothetical protein
VSRRPVSREAEFECAALRAGIKAFPFGLLAALAAGAVAYYLDFGVVLAGTLITVAVVTVLWVITARAVRGRPPHHSRQTPGD